MLIEPAWRAGVGVYGNISRILMVVIYKYVYSNVGRTFMAVITFGNGEILWLYNFNIHHFSQDILEYRKKTLPVNDSQTAGELIGAICAPIGQHDWLLN